MSSKSLLLGALCMVCTALPAVAQGSTTWTWGQKPASTSTSRPAGTAATTGAPGSLPGGIKKAPPRVPLRKYTRDPSMFSLKGVDKSPDLPDLPNYTGNAKVTDVVVAPNAVGGPVYNVRSGCKDEKKVIHDWYQNVLKTNGWSILEDNVSTGFISAKKGTNEVRVSVLSPADPTDKCVILLTYRQALEEKK